MTRASTTVASDHAAVVIGRNEGERLSRCLESIPTSVEHVVYVDSGSADDSVARAERAGAEVLRLDPSRPFTAARGRHEGFQRLLSRRPGTRFVQFVDGDCVLDAGWPSRAAAALESEPEVAIVCGRLRERERDATRYNRLCDLEWDAPSGEVLSCGGNAMVRVSAYVEVGGFDPRLIAGEEPELCLRLRARGWCVRKIDVSMAEHDAAMTRFSEFWRRSVRAGCAAAEGVALHGRAHPRHRALRSSLVYGVALPVGVAVAVAVSVSIGRGMVAVIAFAVALAVLFGLYARVLRHGRTRGWSTPDARLYALACVLQKPAEAQGVLLSWLRRLARRERRITEHRHRAAP